MYAAVTGLGQRVPADVESGMQILNNMILHWVDRAKKINDANLVQQASLGAKYWAEANDLANFQGKFDAARNAIGRGIAHMQGIAPVIMRAESQATGAGPFSPTIEREVEQLQRGSSFMEQVKRTVAGPTGAVTEAVASSVEAIAPGVAGTLRASAWIVPAAIAGGLIFFLSRR